MRCVQREAGIGCCWRASASRKQHDGGSGLGTTAHGAPDAGQGELTAAAAAAAAAAFALALVAAAAAFALALVAAAAALALAAAVAAAAVVAGAMPLDAPATSDRPGCAHPTHSGTA